MCVSVYCFLGRKLIIFIPGTGRSRKRQDNGHARWPARDRSTKCFRIMELTFCFAAKFLTAGIRLVLRFTGRKRLGTAFYPFLRFETLRL